MRCSMTFALCLGALCGSFPGLIKKTAEDAEDAEALCRQHANAPLSGNPDLLFPSCARRMIHSR